MQRQNRAGDSLADGARIASRAEHVRDGRCSDRAGGFAHPAFIRIGPKGVFGSRALLEKIAKAMALMIDAHDRQHAVIPAGLTRLGQFIDHDLTFDRHLLGASSDNVEKLLKGRSPALDLDSIYGHCRRAPCGLRLCDSLASRTLEGALESGAQPGLPCAEDEEDLALARLHLAFIRFHNRLADRLEADGSCAPEDVFEAAREQVTRQYQRALAARFLPRIVDGAVLADVFRRGRRFFELPISVQRSPTSSSTAAPARERMAMPIEFSVAAYGLGYSLVRAGSLWRRRDGGAPTGAPGSDHDHAFHNLVRANLLELASGQQMADLFGVSRLAEREILQGRNGVDFGRLPPADQLTDPQKSELVRNTPLWFYVLREAELNGGLLGAVGGRIVAEVFHRAMEASRYSILHD